MLGEAREEWLQLCELAANEQDSEKLLALVKQINRLLDEKDQRLKQPRRRGPIGPACEGDSTSHVGVTAGSRR